MLLLDASKMHVGGAVRLGISAKANLFVFCAVAFTAAIVGYIVLSDSERLERYELQVVLSEFRESVIKSRAEVDMLASDADFMARAPSTRAITRAATSKDNRDPISGSNLHQLTQLMGSVFSELMLARPSYLQMRLIGIEDNGREIIRVNREGKELRVVPVAELQQKGDRSYFTETLKTAAAEIYFSPIDLNREHGEIEQPPRPMMRAAQKVYDPNGKLFGMVVINMDARRLINNLTQSLPKGEGIRMFLTNIDGDILYHPEDETKVFGFEYGTRYRVQDEYPQVAEYFGPGVAGDNSEYGDHLVESDDGVLGIIRIPIAKENASRDLKLVMQIPKSVINQYTHKMTNRVLGVALALTLLATILNMIFARLLTRPVKSIIDVATAYGEGKAVSYERLPLQRADEIGDLALVIKDAIEKRRAIKEALQKSNDNLEQEVVRRTQVLAESEGRLRAILDTAVDGILTINDHGEIRQVNAAVKKIFGYEEEELLGKNIKMLMPEPYHSHHDQYLEHYMSTGERKIIGIGREVSAMRKNGEVFPIDLAVSEVKKSGERIFVGIVRDISERKRGEDALRSSYEEVMRSNRALDEFAYIASHDLKEPLRGIYNFSELLKQKMEGRLNEEEKKKFDTIIQLSRKMEARISSLLRYSQLGSIEFQAKREDMQQVVNESLELLQPFLKSHNAVVRVSGELPQVVCSRVAIAEVLQNLITNAVKYNKQEERVVEIGCETKDGRQIFYVRDNGIGIPEKHFDSIFRIFKRLHSEEAFEGGTGVGLTFVRRILESQGGRIWLESEEGQGTTFFFTLTEGARDEQARKAA